ncbi:MAG: Branched-chain amino acid transporter substrate-binding protein [Ilumatobacteraceae bacterium]|nr:Branched-chain amino acid transporter substrate-binding protein [Ilumatobacteraceae bacterium]
MRNRPIRLMAVMATLALVAGACGSDRDTSSSSTAAPTTTEPASTTAAPTTVATTTAGSAVDTSGATGDSGVAETTGSTGATEAATAATETTVPAGPMFGDAPWPCGPGSGANKDDGSEVGVTADSITISGGDDAGYSGAPGLDHEATDAMKALVAKCNELGGINGRKITFDYFDAAIFNVGPAIQGACDAKSFFLVGEAWSFDSNQEETRLGCNLPAVPTFSVSAAFANGKDVYQGTPNPADELPAGLYAMTSKELPDATKKVGLLAGGFSATQESRDKVAAVAGSFGWGFSETNLEYNPAGEADWTPFVKQLQAAGSTAVWFSGGCLPNLQLFEQTAKANGFDVPVFVDSNFYEAGCAAANTDGALDKMYVRMAFIPFEEASTNKATQDYLDLIKASGGDVSLLGAQATSSFLLWATAASACGDTLTRACTLQNLANTHSWTGHGLHAEDDPGGNHPPQCNIMLQLQGTKYVRVAPEKPGTYECDPSWIAPVTGVKALDAAKLDANRISQQFAAG